MAGWHAPTAPHSVTHEQSVHVGVQLLHARSGSRRSRIVPSTGDGASQACPELPRPFVVVQGISDHWCQLGRFRRWNPPELSPRPEAGQPHRTVILHQKVNESIVIEIPWSRFASTEADASA